MKHASDLQFGSRRANRINAPIRSDFLREGSPVAHCAVLSRSADEMACTVVWDCTAGRFVWQYDADETIYVLEGEVTIKDASGVNHHLGVGDSVFFPAGSSAEWVVEHFVCKVAFCRNPLPRPVLAARAVYRAIRRSARRFLGRARADVNAPSPFGGA